MKTQTELSWLIKTGDMDELKKHLSAGSVNVAVKGRSPLHIAADFGQTEVAALLLSLGADVEAVDAHGLSPLLAAVAEDHEDTAKLLIQHGAKTSGSTPDGRSYADWTENPDMKKLLA